MQIFHFEKKMDRFEVIILGLKLKFYRYLRLIRETYLMMHYSLLRDNLKSKYNISLPKEAYHHLSENVELVMLALKELRVPSGHRKTCTIPETAVYQWLKNKKDKNLRWGYNEGNVYSDLVHPEQRMRELEKSLTNSEGYDPSKCIVCVRKNNTIIDGQHRCAALYHKYGENYKILVVREK